MTGTSTVIDLHALGGTLAQAPSSASGAFVFVVAGVVGLIALCVAIVLLQFASLYITAMTSNAPVTLTQMLGMRLRKVDVKTAVYSYIRLRKAEVPVSIERVETHMLAGGRILHVVSAMVAARAAGIPLEWNTVTAMDLMGDDVVANVRQLVDEQKRQPAAR